MNSTLDRPLSDAQLGACEKRETMTQATNETADPGSPVAAYMNPGAPQEKSPMQFSRQASISQKVRQLTQDYTFILGELKQACPKDLSTKTLIKTADRVMSQAIGEVNAERALAARREFSRRWDGMAQMFRLTMMRVSAGPQTDEPQTEPAKTDGAGEDNTAADAAK